MAKVGFKNSDALMQDAQLAETPPAAVQEDQPAEEQLVTTVAVAPDCRWDTVQAAGLVWGKQMVEVPLDASYLDELRANPLIIVGVINKGA